VKGRGKKLEHSLARALWEEAREAGLEEKTAEELATLGSALRSEAKLRQVLLHPAIPLERKVELVRSALGLSGPAEMLVKALVAFKAPGLVAGIRRAYLGFLAAGAREVTVNIASADPLSPGERAALGESMAHALGKPVRIAVHIRRDLLGGLMVRVGERIVDGTLKGTFDRLERELVASSSQKTSSGGRKTASPKGRK